MSGLLTLECNGLEQPLLGWGIVKASLLLISQGIDTLTFDITVTDMFADPVFVYEDTINLKLDGVRVFSGQITTMPVVGNANAETQSYVASGPWWILSRIVYKQPRLVYDGAILAPVATDSSRTVLFMGNSIASHVDNGTLIKGAIFFGTSRFAIPIQVGTVSLNFQPPMQEVKDITLADVIIYSCKWTPDAVTWFDYSVDPPAFNCARRSELTQVTIDPLAGNLVNEIKIRPRPDLVVPGVLFVFEQTVVVAGVQKVSLTSESAGDITAIDTIVHTFTLQGATDYVQELPPSGIAAGFYAATNTLHYEGEITLTEEDCSFLISPGKGLQFGMTAPAKYQTMKALVQQTQFDLVQGISTVVFGPPSQLGPQDYNALLAASRAPGATSTLAGSGATSGGTGNTPTPPPPNPSPATPPGPNGETPHASIELCDGTTICVLTCGLA